MGGTGNVDYQEANQNDSSKAAGTSRYAIDVRG
jgi:hypothetical protein